MSSSIAGMAVWTAQCDERLQPAISAQVPPVSDERREARAQSAITRKEVMDQGSNQAGPPLLVEGRTFESVTITSSEGFPKDDRRTDAVTAVGLPLHHQQSRPPRGNRQPTDN